MSLDKNDTKKIIKLLVLNIGIGVVDTIIFSPGLLGIQIVGASAFEMASGATAALMSIIVLAFGNYKIITEKEAKGDLPSKYKRQFIYS